MHRHLTCILTLATCSSALSASSQPSDMSDRFDPPPGFHIYRAASADLTGGSYSLTFDGEGRLLVGDGSAVRRLGDKDGDGVFDSFEVIARGLGSRGPQGLLVYADRLYAVGGDGVQLFEGYGSAAPLIHRGRLGQPFKTGGDHDGWLYFMVGNGAGTKDRIHITEESSPCLFEREASVFRIRDPPAQLDPVHAARLVRRLQEQRRGIFRLLADRSHGLRGAPWRGALARHFPD